MSLKSFATSLKICSDEIKENFAKNETEIKFIPRRSPHWGGLWETAI